MALQVVEVPNIGGGVNDYVTPQNILPSEVQDTSRNIRGEADAYLSRKGYTTFADLQDGEGVNAMGSYTRLLKTNDKLAMVQASQLYLIDPATDTTWARVFETFLDQKTTIDAMDATTGWTASTDCAVALNTTDELEGTGCINLTKTGTTTTSAEMSKTISTTDFTNLFVNVNLYITDTTALAKLATTGTYKITLTDSGGSETLTATFDKDEVTENVGGWTRLRIYVDSMTDSGSVDKTDITKISVELTTTGTAITWSAGDFIWDYAYSSTIPTDADMVAYRDWLFLFNGVDKPIRVEGTTVTQDFTAPASVTTANFTPAFGDIYGTSLFVAGVPTATNTVFISKASSSAAPENVYDFSGALTSFGNANEILLQSRVTAIRKLSTAVVIFTVDGAFYVPGLKEFGSTVTFDVQPVGGASGCESQRTCTVVENDIYYLTPQKEIKSVKRGFSDTLSMLTTPMSTKIQKFLQSEIDDDQSSAFAYYDQTSKLYKLHLKAKGGTENNITIVGDINDLDEQGVPAWFIDDSRPFNAGVYHKGKPYVGSAQIGQAFNDEDGNADDDDGAIITKRVSKNFTANNPTTTKNFREVVLYGEMTTSTVQTATVYVDGVSVCEVTITAADIPTQSSVSGGGIGTEDIGGFEIASEGEGETDASTRLEYVKRIPIRQTGKTLRVDFDSDGNNNDFKNSHLQYAFLAKTYLYNPVIEK